MDANTTDIISKLKFISRIKPNQKIDTKFMRIQENTIFNSFIRTLFPDNRHNALVFFRSTISRAFDIISHLEEDNIQLSINILNDISLSMVGLTNFKKTYESDTMFCCEIDTLVEDIKIKLLTYRLTDTIIPINNTSR